MTDLAALPRSWYRQPLVWMIIAIPLSAVIAGFVTLWLAVTTDDGLVVDDYYRQGLAINQQLQRDAYASRMQLSATLLVDRETAVITVMFNKGRMQDYPQILPLLLRHVMHSENDVAVKLQHAQGAQYIGQLNAALAAGGWYVELGTSQWRLSKRHDFSDLGPLLLDYQP